MNFAFSFSRLWYLQYIPLNDNMGSSIAQIRKIFRFCFCNHIGEVKHFKAHKC